MRFVSGSGRARTIAALAERMHRLVAEQHAGECLTLRENKRESLAERSAHLSTLTGIRNSKQRSTKGVYYEENFNIGVLL